MNNDLSRRAILYLKHVSFSKADTILLYILTIQLIITRLHVTFLVQYKKAHYIVVHC